MCYIFCYFFQEYDNQAETLVSGLAISADDDDLDLSKFSFGLILLCENMCKHLYFFFSRAIIFRFAEYALWSDG